MNPTGGARHPYSTSRTVDPSARDRCDTTLPCDEGVIGPLSMTMPANDATGTATWDQCSTPALAA